MHWYSCGPKIPLTHLIHILWISYAFSFISSIIPCFFRFIITNIALLIVSKLMKFAAPNLCTYDTKKIYLRQKWPVNRIKPIICDHQTSLNTAMYILSSFNVCWWWPSICWAVQNDVNKRWRLLERVLYYV